MTKDIQVTDIGTFNGLDGMERLRREAETLLLSSPKIVIAVAGLPGCGKTVFVKDFARLGFGHLRKNDVMVIDDNTLYSTTFWKLKWEKIMLNKDSWPDYLNALDCKMIIFSNWVPSRFLDYADILVNLTVSERLRLFRLNKREKKNPKKIGIQMKKTTIPIEEPFSVNLSITLRNDNRISFLWCLFWMLRRGIPQ
jgi:hypothetical protein